MPSLGLATNAVLPSADAVTSCGSLTVGTRPSSFRLTGSTIASALASRSNTSNRAGDGVCAAGRTATNARVASDVTDRTHFRSELMQHLRLGADSATKRAISVRLKPDITYD